jgi:M6 family metalloprotease-like protein
MMMGVPMTTKYTQLSPRFHNRGLPALAVALVAAITFATRSQATETGHVPTGSAGNISAAACAIATPELKLSLISQKNAPGSNPVYAISLTNKDDAACSASSFDLTIAYLPSGWSGDLSTHTLSLIPGATGTATLSVNPSNDTPEDSYRLQVAVSDAQKANHAKTAIATYTLNDAATVDGDVATLAVAAGETSNQANASFSPEPDNPGTAGDGVTLDDVTIPASSGASIAKNGNLENAKRLTLRLTGLLSAYNQTSESAKANALNELIAAAEERHALLASMIEDNPGAVLYVAIPPRIRDSMPTEVRGFIEQRTNLTGEIEVRYEDYEDGHARLRQFLKTKSKSTSLHFKSDSPYLLSGVQVTAHGVYLDLGDNLEAGGAMALESGEQVLTLAASGGNKGGSNNGTPASVANTLGEQKTLVILVNFQDNPTEPYTAAEAQNMVFGTTSNFFMENSYQQTWLSGDVVGWYTIPLSSTVCDIGSLHSYANAAVAAESVVDLSTYAHLVYAFPRNACGWGGLSSVGGNPSQSDINGDLQLHTIAHELGHGLGLWHSHALDCGTVTLGPACNTIEYGDIFDHMGSTNVAGHFNAFQKERLGWLNSWATPPITTVLTDGTYTLDTYEPVGSGPKALKILKSTDSTTGQRTWYYIESRQAIGFDGFLANNTNALNGVIVHTGSESGGNTSYLLDMNAANDTSIWDWSMNSPLVVGQSYLDPESGLSVTTEWVTPTGAAVSISFGGGSTDPGSTDPGSTNPGSTDPLTVAVSTNHLIYTLNDWVYVETDVSAGGSPVANADVSITIGKPDGSTVATGNVTTGADGIAMYKLRLRKKDPVGTYRAAAVSATNVASGSATTDFSVQ